MKIGIVTIPDFNNYGNRLQNYALQVAVEKLGVECHSLVLHRPNLIKSYIKSLIINNGKSLREKRLDMLRLKAFLNFDHKYVNTIELPDKFTSELAKKYEYFLVGSDQVWNPAWSKDLFHRMFLEFANDDQKIAYAPSFGVSEIPNELRKKYADGLKSFAKLSVREESGASIVKTLINKEIPVVLDPTMLLNSQEWKEVAKLPSAIKNEKYLLTYFLGGTNNEYKSCINKMAKEKHLKVLNLLDKETKEMYANGPAEFLGLILNADLVLTDSFHASVFSILFERQFIVFNRLGSGAGMSSRITTLLKKFGLENCLYQNDLNDYLPDYTLALDKLEEEQKNSYEYLKESLNLL